MVHGARYSIDSLHGVSWGSLGRAFCKEQKVITVCDESS